MEYMRSRKFLQIKTHQFVPYSATQVALWVKRLLFEFRHFYMSYLIEYIPQILIDVNPLPQQLKKYRTIISYFRNNIRWTAKAVCEAVHDYVPQEAWEMRWI